MLVEPYGAGIPHNAFALAWRDFPLLTACTRHD